MRLLVALVVLVAALAPTVESAGEGPRLLLRIDNSYEEMPIRLSVYDDAEALVFERELTAQRGLTVVEATLEPATYWIELASRDPRSDLLSRAFGDDSYVAQGAQMEGCPGPTAADFTLTPQGAGTRGNGCTVLTTHAVALLEDARAAKSGLALASFTIPAPGDADRGVYGGSLFEWRGDADFLDAWGRPARGPEVRYLSGGASMYASSDPVTGVGAKAEVDDTVEVLRWMPGETTPHAWSTTLPGFGTSESATSTSVTIERELRYDEFPGLLGCGLRNGLQGRTLRPGDTMEAREICALWDGPAFRAAAPITIEGYRLLPLYQLEESDERVLVRSVFLLDGVAYPFYLGGHELPAGGFLSSYGIMLTRHQPGGAPIPLEGTRAAEPAVALAPLDPLRGPALGDASAARIPFPLEDAADAALADPTLRELAAVLARPDAALIGASYGVAQDQGSPLAMHRWLLVYAASDVAPAFVLCERPASPSPAPLPIATPPRCRETSMTGLVDPLAGAYPIGRDALPRASPTFAQAIARWDATRGDAGEPVTHAVYLGYADGRAPRLEVGAGIPEPLTPADTTTAGSSDHVALELATGRTLASVQVEQAGAALGDAPLARVGPSTLRAADAPFAPEESIPLVVGAGVGLALLALLGFLLYSRLVRARVLDDATRGRIHEVVAREPGLHASGVLERLGKQSGVGEYHLGVLVREGYLTAVTTPGFRRYFVTGRFGPNEMRAIAALREGQNQKLFEIIRGSPGIQLGELAASAGMSVPYASKGVARLVEAGLVDKVQVGRSVALHALAAPEAGLS